MTDEIARPLPKWEDSENAELDETRWNVWVLRGRMQDKRIRKNWIGLMKWAAVAGLVVAGIWSSNR